MTIRARIVGCGSYLPARVMTNEQLAQMVDTSDAWIRQRTGIGQRHIAAKDETTADLALAAARNALAAAGQDPAQLDAILVATTTPDHVFPAVATKIQAALGMTGGFAMDLQAVCSGFVYALAVADNFIRLGQARSVLVIGAETFSRLLDWQDRGTCVLFGDGAGAVVLRAEAGTGSAADHGVLSTHLRSDGRHYSRLQVDGGPGSDGRVGHVRMDGKEVFRHAVANMAEIAMEAVAANGVTPDAIDWLVPHQANIRILESTAKRLNMPAEKVITTVDRHANTSAASIPLALDQAVRDGRIQPGQLLLMVAMGGGFTWGAALARW